MTEIFNKIEVKKTRKRLRNNLTKPEIIVWLQLKGKRINGCKFRRQCSIGKYIVDFYCPEKKLVIEIDGPSHYATAESIIKDKARQQFLESLGLKVIRFFNWDIIRNINEVLEIIEKETSPIRPGRITPPSQGGD